MVRPEAASIAAPINRSETGLSAKSDMGIPGLSHLETLGWSAVTLNIQNSRAAVSIGHWHLFI